MPSVCTNHAIIEPIIIPMNIEHIIRPRVVLGAAKIPITLRTTDTTKLAEIRDGK
jgi:hypothetical protein